MEQVRRYGLLGVLVVLVLIGLAVSSHSRQAAEQNHESALLHATWQDYKRHIWESTSGRTVNSQDQGVTTSEGQSYTLLRAVWENDQPTFTATWNWTANNLQRGDKLFSWRWGKRPDGSYGVLTGEGGQNTASDADTNIALALLMAGQKWHKPQYTASANAIIGAIWRQEVVMVGSTPYMAADNLEKSGTSPTFIVNPSYVAPYAYRIFAKADTADNWNSLVNSSYSLIQWSSTSPLDTNGSADLPPDWVAVNRANGQLSPTGNSGQGTDFGYNAFRTVWQLSLDWHWFHDPRAKQTLGQFGFLSSQWTQQQKLWAIYGHDGRPKANYTSFAFYGGTLGYFQVTHPDQANAIVRSQLDPLYSTKSGGLTQQLDYYDNNWVWFGLALYADKLPNLAQGVAS